MTDRTTLALAACQGLSDAELADRGPQSFKKMIERKRKYAASARILIVTAVQQEKKIEALKAQVAALTQQVATFQAIEKLEAPVDDTTQAASMLASIASKK